MSTTECGKLYEAKAREFYESRGAEVIVTNYRIKSGEIDLVVEEGEILVFVEVRFRRDTAWINGLESMSYQKRVRIRKAAEKFLLIYEGSAKSIRFDAVYWHQSNLVCVPQAWQY